METMGVATWKFPSKKVMSISHPWDIFVAPQQSQTFCPLTLFLGPDITWLLCKRWCLASQHNFQKYYLALPPWPYNPTFQNVGMTPTWKGHLMKTTGRLGPEDIRKKDQQISSNYKYLSRQSGDSGVFMVNLVAHFLSQPQIFEFQTHNCWELLRC